MGSDLMRNKLFYATVVGSCAMLASLQARQDDWSLNNRWTVTGDWVYLIRQDLKNKTIVNSNTSGLHLGTKKALDRFGFESGYRVALFYQWNCENSFEGNYTNSGKWEGSSRVVSANNDLYFPFSNRSFSNDFNNASRARETYTSQFDNAELNWWHYFTPRRVNYFSFSTILGLRYFKLDETFKLSMTRGANTSSYDVDAVNKLWGGHAGFSLQWNPTCNLSWEMIPRVGAFFNKLSQNTHVRDQNNTSTLAKYTRDGVYATFLGDFVFKGTYQLGCHFNLHVGYELLYLDGVGVAPDQITFTTDPTLDKKLDRHASALMHGAFAGLSFSF